MKNLLRNRNFLLVLALAVVILGVFAASRWIRHTPDTLPDLSAAQEQGELSRKAPRGYVLAQANGESRWIALPADDEDLLITISREDDPGISNTLRLWKDGFRMDSSTCDNQDCVIQGDVTLENMGSRVLRNMVICLPHSVAAELYSTEELEEMLAEQTK